MTSIRTFIFAVATATSAAPASAQIWSQQPTTVLGVELGAKVSSLPLPVCGKPTRGASGDGYAEQCIDPPFEGRPDRLRWLRGMPRLGEVGYAASLVLHDGQVESLYLVFDQFRFDQMKAILIEKYGAPSRTGTERVTSGAGAVLSSETLAWLGDRVTIDLKERSGKVTDSLVVFSSRDVVNRHAKAASGVTKEAAGKL